MSGYVVVFEGDEHEGFSAYSPGLPGVVAAGDTRAETESLMRAAMVEHIAMLRDLGEAVPEPATHVDATVLDIPAA